MKLTGKAEKDFNEWYVRDLRSNPYEGREYVPPLTGFLHSHLSVQWGVFQDFFDSVGLEVCVDRHVDDELNFTSYFDWVICHSDTNDNYGGGSVVDSRAEARTAAIEKACEIYNNQ